MVQMLQWEIYDAYIADQDKQRAQEELNKQKAAAKKAVTVTETAETSQEPAKARQAPTLQCMLKLARYCCESVHVYISIPEHTVQQGHAKRLTICTHMHGRFYSYLQLTCAYSQARLICTRLYGNIL